MSERAKSAVVALSGAMTRALTATGDLFTHEEARVLGLRDADLRRLIRDGYLVRLRRGIYIRAADLAAIAPDNARRHALEVRALALALSRQRIAAAGTSAGRIHGLEFLDPPRRALVVVTGNPGVAGMARGDLALRVAPLPPGHLCDRFGAPLTSPARTLIDLTAELNFVAGVHRPGRGDPPGIGVQGRDPPARFASAENPTRPGRRCAPAHPGRLRLGPRPCRGRGGRA